MAPTGPEDLHISDNPYPGRSPLPALTERDFAWAQVNPGKWQYYVDPRADKSAVQEVNVLGGRLADDKGGFTDVWVNPDFTPMPESVDIEFATELELVLWRLSWGFNDLGRFIDAFSRSELLVVLPADDPQGDKGWPLRSSRGELILDVYTSAGRLPPDVNPWLRRKASGRELLERVCPMENVYISFHSGNDANPVIPGSDMVRFWREWCDVQGATAETEKR
ncbi:hypothetical protein [Nocardia beijingensis]